MSDERDKHWQLPVLDRMREDFARVAARDAEAISVVERPRRSFRLGIGAAASVIAAVVIAVVLLEGGGDQAAADVRDAPAAAVRAGSFSFRTQVTVGAGRATESRFQSGLVDLSMRASRTRLRGTSSRGIDRILIGRELYFRVSGSNRAREAWNRLTLESIAGTSGEAALAPLRGPVSVRAIESLRDANGIEVIARGERIGEIPVTHYRLPMSAQEFIAAHGTTTAGNLRNVHGQLDVWLGADDLPRRVAAHFKRANNSFTVSTTYADYGIKTNIRAPEDAVPAKQRAALTTEDPLVVNMRIALAAD